MRYYKIVNDDACYLERRKKIKWDNTSNSFAFIISAVMFGCGIGGVLAAILSLYW
jgi:hypothetical protein